MNLWPWRREDADDEPDQIAPDAATETVPAAGAAEPAPLPSNVVELRKGVPAAPEPGAVTLTKPTPGRLARALTPYVERPLWPPKAQAKAASLWWAKAVGKIAAYVALHPWVLFSELRP